jgi:DNA-binding beta-propeller fold protein YncE/serine/threonine protein kinase/transcriptional regulator with XRE-family HTH domain
MEAVNHSPFGEFLRRDRIAAGLTQDELAERAHLSARAISDLERGVNRAPRAYTVRQLADALDLSPPDRVTFETAARAAIASAPPARLLPEALPVGRYLGALAAEPLIARQEEVRRILTAFDAAAEGHGQLMLLAGEAGIGKTRLAQEVHREALRRGFLVAVGCCSMPQRQAPVSSFLDILGALSQAVSAEVREAIPDRWPSLDWLLSDQRPSALPVNVPAESDLARLCRAVTDFIGAIAHDVPVVLLLDDLQWADDTSLQLLWHLARHIRTSPLLILGTYRDTEVEADHTLEQMLRALGRERLVERVPVRRLTEDETATLVAATLDRADDAEGFAEFVYRRSKGNPFFAERMVRALGGRYRLIRQIGAGGMGRVFEAIDTETGRQVAAKITFARAEVDPRALLRFEQEGAVLATLQHPNVVTVYGTFLEEHASCIAMELLDGQSLRTILRPASPGAAEDPHLDRTRQTDGGAGLPLRRIKTLTQQVAAALACAHERGIVHRDVKPENIMVLEGDRVKVTDFGIARLLRPIDAVATMTSTGLTMGTPSYMAPEQIRSTKIDGRADIYALGAVMYEMVTGRPPFDGDDPLAIAVKHVLEAPVPPRSLTPGLPEDWNAVILRMLEKNPADRVQSAAALEQVIRDLSEDHPAEPASEAAEHGNQEPTGNTGTHAKRRSLAIWKARNRAVTRRATMVVGSAVMVAALVAAGVLAQGMSRGPVSGSSLGSFAPWGEALAAAGTPGATTTRTAQGSFKPWGSGPLKGPAGVAVDDQGHVYVVDQDGNRVSKLSSSGRLLVSWGTKGSRPGQFNAPGGIAVDRQSNVFVADTDNNRIEKFSAGGTLLAVLGSGGDNPGQFSFPRGIAIDAQGDIYVADAGHDRIQKLSPTGEPIVGWGAWLAPHFSFPTGVTVDPAGNVYAALTGWGSVLKLSPTGAKVGQWGTEGARPSQFLSPEGIALDAQGNMYVSDARNHRIQELSPKGEPLHAWGAQDAHARQFGSPSGVAIDARGTVYIADHDRRRIQALPSAYPLEASLPSPSGGPAQVSLPAGVAVDRSGNVYVAEEAGYVHKLSPDGQLLDRWGGQGPSGGYLGPLSAIAVDGTGNIYLADYTRFQIRKLSPDGKTVAVWGHYGTGPGQFEDPESVAVDARGNIYVADAANNRIEKLSPEGTPLATWGTTGTKPGQFVGPRGVAVGPDGNIYVSDYGDGIDSRIQQFSPTGRLLAVWAYPTLLHEFSWGLAVDARGAIYVFDWRSGHMLKLSSAGKLVAQWEIEGIGANSDRPVTGVAVDAQGSVYLADSLNKLVHKLAPDGHSIDGWGLPAPVPTRFDHLTGIAVASQDVVYAGMAGPKPRIESLTPRGSPLREFAPPDSVHMGQSSMAVDPSGDIYVADGRADRIDRISPSGQLLARWSGMRLGLRHVSGITGDAWGNVYVADVGTDRIAKLSPTGSVLWRIGGRGTGPERFETPSAVAVDARGTVYVADTGNHRIQVLASTGRPLAMWDKRGTGSGHFEAPDGVAVDAQGDVWVADAGTGSIQKISRQGKLLARWGGRGSRPGQFDVPRSIAVDMAGTVYVEDVGNRRIQMLPATHGP